MAHERPFLGETLTPTDRAKVGAFVGGLFAAVIVLPWTLLLWTYHLFAHALGLPCPF